MESPSKKSNKKTIVVAFLFVILFVGLGVLGFLQYQSNQETNTLRASTTTLKATNKKLTAKTKLSEDKLAEALAANGQKSAEQQVLEAAKCDSKSKASCQLEWDQNLARVTLSTEDGSGASEIYYRNPQGDGSWAKVWGGNGDIPQEVITRYKLPDVWVGPSCSDCTM